MNSISEFAVVEEIQAESLFNMIEEQITKYSAILYGFKTFEDLKELKTWKIGKLNSLISIDSVPIITTNTYGGYGMCYSYLGKDFQFTEDIKVNGKKTVSHLFLSQS